MAKVTSTEIKIALEHMHGGYKDYFITECKTCSTYFPDPQGLLIFDGLAITKSYTKPNIIGYEIKVSRGDFLQDNKWHLYLQYCNEFYFVVPKGLISKDEIPEDVGLIYYNPENKTLKKVRKAKNRRDIEEPVGVYKYIIYSRLEQDRIPFYESKAEYAKDYLEDRKEKKYIGSTLGTKMAKELGDAHKRLEDLSHKEDELENWSKVKKLLKKYDLVGWGRHRKEDQWLDDLEQALKSSYPKDLDNIKEDLHRIIKRMDKIKEEYSGDQSTGEES